MNIQHDYYAHIPLPNQTRAEINQHLDVIQVDKTPDVKRITPEESEIKDRPNPNPKSTIEVTA